MLRFALLSAHYRQPLEWSEALIAQSKATLDRLYRSVRRGRAKRNSRSVCVLEALADDLNTPLALVPAAAIEDGATLRLASRRPLVAGHARRGDRIRPGSRAHGRRRGIDRRCIAARREAKQRRDFAEADRIRAELAEEGVLLEDGPNGTIWRRA